MPPQIFEYLKTQRVGVLAVEMLDGSPHGATIHFAHTEEPFVFYFETSMDYRKTEALTGRPQSRASFVVGTDESNMKTLQLDGFVQIISDEEKGLFIASYFMKFPGKKDKVRASAPVYFKFTPTWWRFTDWTIPEGKKIWTSN